MTGKEHLLELWSERKNMQQVIHELIQNSETGVVAYDRFYKELETRYNTSFPKNNEDMILKGILDNVLWNMVGNKELCEHITENGKLYCYHSIYLEVLLALFCGLRKGEIMGLKYKDFDFLQHTVSINRQITRDYDVVIEEDRTFKIATQRLSTKPPKSYSSYRTLIISAFIFDELEIRKKENEEILKLTENHEWAEYICLGVKGNIKSDGTYTEAIKRICKRNGLPHITMHGLRHMFATILIEQSVSLEKISKLMGHKSVATTFEIYCGIMEAKKEIAKTIDSVMDPAIGAVKVRSKGGIVCM